MFGKMRVTKIFEMSKLETVDEAVAKLLEFAEYPQIFRWFQFPAALVVFVAHADSLAARGGKGFFRRGEQ